MSNFALFLFGYLLVGLGAAMMKEAYDRVLHAEMYEDDAMILQMVRQTRDALLWPWMLYLVTGNARTILELQHAQVKSMYRGDIKNPNFKPPKEGFQAYMVTISAGKNGLFGNFERIAAQYSTSLIELVELCFERATLTPLDPELLFVDASRRPDWPHRVTVILTVGSPDKQVLTAIEEAIEMTSKGQHGLTAAST